MTDAGISKDFTGYDQAIWQNPLVSGINKLPARNSAWPCPDAASGWESNYDRSPWVMSLNGQWKFHWAKDPDECPKTFFMRGFNDSDWQSIPVPSCWEIEGFKTPPVGQANYGVPIYSNDRYPFATQRFGIVMDEPPPEFTAHAQRNPVGSYRRSFTVPENWPADGRRILHFAGVYSAIEVWVNGREIGFSKDSRLPAEFDVTDALQPGENELAIRVYRWCDGSYLEDQDFWRLSGIYRDVFLYHTPVTTIWDFYVDTHVDPSLRSATVGLRYLLRGQAQPDTRIRLTLRDPDGVVIHGGPLIDETVCQFNAEASIRSFMLETPRLWTNETPQVYDALVELVLAGRVIEARRIDIGFRRVEIVGKRLLLNGVPIKVKGINRHEASPDGGYVVSRALMEKDLSLIKQGNVNFVRCSHYPNDPRWYELCNRWGMLVMDEANVESHGLSYHKKVLPGDDPRWASACVERMTRMVVRDRNHPCVILWSLGNEAGYGKAFPQMRAAARALDPQLRPMQYADMNVAGDVDSQTYPTVEWCHEHLSGKAIRKGERGEIGIKEQHGEYPSGRGFVANEYALAHGNSGGNLQDYWDVFESHEMFWGGFIWQWCDLALFRRDEHGNRVLAYGGDFGDAPNDGSFCMNGIVSAEREPRPTYWEMQKVYQFIRVIDDDVRNGRVRVRNKHFFLGLEHMRGEWVLEENGNALQQGTLERLETPAGRETTVSIPWTAPTWKAGAEYFLTVRFRLANDQPWAPAGQVVAWDQIQISNGATPAATMHRGTRAVIQINENASALESYIAGGRERLAGPVLPNFWRVPTDSDLGWKMPELMGAWKDIPFHNGQVSVKHEADITARWNLPFEGSYLTVRYQTLDNGVLRITMTLNLSQDAPELPRMGVRLAIGQSFRHIRWYGRGPHESYIDRKTSAAVAIHRANVDEWITPYVRPQENGNRTDVRWIEFTDGAGSGLRIAAVDRLLGVTAWPYSLEDLEATTHHRLLPQQDRITVCIDGFQMGIGGDNSWGAPVRDPYRLIRKGEYSFAFDLMPIPEEKAL